MATPEQIAQIKEQWNALPQEQRQQILELVQSKRRPKPTTTMSRTGRPIDPFQGQEQTDIGYTDNPYADALAGAMGTAAAVLPAAAGIAGAGATGGLAGAARAALPLAKRAVLGAGAGAAVGSVPILGMGAKEGAQLGAMLAVGQKGTGALWKHGKRKRLIEWLLKKVTGEADEAAVTRTAARAGRAAGKAGRASTAAKLPKYLSQEQRNIVKQLQGLSQSSGANREAMKEVAKEVFGDDWRKVMRWIDAPQTRL